MQKPKPAPAFVSRETGAALLDISGATWDAMAKAGQLPDPCRIGVNATTPRWYWPEVVQWLIDGRKQQGERPHETFVWDWGAIDGATQKSTAP